MSAIQNLPPKQIHSIDTITKSTSPNPNTGFYNNMTITYAIPQGDSQIYDMQLIIECKKPMVKRLTYYEMLYGKANQQESHLYELIRHITIKQDGNILERNTPLQLFLIDFQDPIITKNGQLMVRINNPILYGANIEVEVEFTDHKTINIIDSKLLIRRGYNLEDWMCEYNHTEQSSYAIHSSGMDVITFKYRGYLECLKLVLMDDIVEFMNNIPEALPTFKELKISIGRLDDTTPTRTLCQFDANTIECVRNGKYYEIPIYAQIDIDTEYFLIEYKINTDAKCSVLHVVSSFWKKHNQTH